MLKHKINYKKLKLRFKKRKKDYKKYKELFHFTLIQFNGQVKMPIKLNIGILTKKMINYS